MAREFCAFNNYHYGMSLWEMIHPSFGTLVYSLKGHSRSTTHSRKRDLHQGTNKGIPCFDNDQGTLVIGIMLVY